MHDGLSQRSMSQSWMTVLRSDRHVRSSRHESNAKWQVLWREIKKILKILNVNKEFFEHFECKQRIFWNFLKILPDNELDGTQDQSQYRRNLWKKRKYKILLILNYFRLFLRKFCEQFKQQFLKNFSNFKKL